MSASASADEKSAATAPANLQDLPDIQDVDKDKDVAIAMVGEHRVPIDSAVERRVVRKIDMFLIPAMIVGYGLVYYDKVSLRNELGQWKELVAKILVDY